MQVRRRARFAVGHVAVLNVVVVPLLRALLPDAVIMIADNAAVEDGVSQPHAHITGGAGWAGWVAWAGWAAVDLNKEDLPSKEDNLREQLPLQDPICRHLMESMI